MTIQPSEDSGWKSLYRIDGAAALIAALIFRRWLGAEAALFSGQKPPSTVIDWLTLLQTNRLLGLAFLNGFDLVNYALVGLIFLGLYAALRQVNPGLMTLALGMSALGIAVFFASNQAFALLSLSNQYAAATDEVQRSQILAAGRALLTINDPTSASQGAVSFLLVTAAGLIIALVMLQDSVFSKTSAYVGIVANLLGLGFLVTLAFAPALNFVPLSASAPFLLIWYLLIGVKLLRLAPNDPKVPHPTETTPAPVRPISNQN